MGYGAPVPGLRLRFERRPCLRAQILERFPDADGILCSSDMTALSVYKYLAGRGIRVPEEIMLVALTACVWAAL